MNKKQEKVEVEKIINKFEDMLDLDTINNIIDNTNVRDIGKVSRKTIYNISKWALNGASNKEIASNLEITDKQFQTLCTICPVLVYIMQTSRELAEVVLAGSLYQRAIGGQKVRKQQAVKMNDFDCDGNKIGEHIEIVEIWEELPPDSNLLKYLATKKLSEKFGDEIVDNDKEVRDAIDNMSTDQIKKLEEELLKVENNENERKS